MLVASHIALTHVGSSIKRHYSGPQSTAQRNTISLVAIGIPISADEEPSRMTIISSHQNDHTAFGIDDAKIDQIPLGLILDDDDDEHNRIGLLVAVVVVVVVTSKDVTRKKEQNEHA